MRTDYLKTLHVVAQVGSFSRAAAELCVTQSAISQRIKQLEDHYGYQLLDRAGPVPILTEAGRLVVRRAEQILKIEAKLQNELKQQGGKSRLSICCTPTFGAAFLPQVIEQFMINHSDNINLTFMFHSFNQVIKCMLENEFDLAVTEHCEQLEIPGFQMLELPDDELIFISAPSLDIPAGEVSIQTLFRQTLIARKIGCSSRQLLEANLTKTGQTIEEFNRTIIMDDLRLTLETVMNGGGLAFISRCMAAAPLSSGVLREHWVPSFTHRRRRTVIVNKERLQETNMADFVACIHDLFSGKRCPATA